MAEQDDASGAIPAPVALPSSADASPREQAGTSVEPTSTLARLIDERDFDAVLERQVTQARDNEAALWLVILEHVRPARFDAKLTNHHLFRKAIELVRARARDVDVIARHGEDQITIIVPGLDSREVASFTMAMQEILERHRFGSGGHTIPVALGVAALEPDFTEGWELLAAAQNKLDLARRAHPVRVSEAQVYVERDPCTRVRRTRDACIVVIDGAELGRRYDIEGGTITLGRATVGDIRPTHDSVARNHATILADDTGVKIRDHQHPHGTYVNDRRIQEAYLNDGDVIKVGPSTFKVLISDDIDGSYQEEISRLSTIDDLTQVFNQGYFTVTLERELSRARRHSRALALVLFDIDGFERCNQAHGLRASDHVLRQVAGIVRDRARVVDVVARCRGDELAVIIPDTNLRRAAELAETIRSQIEQARFVFDDKPIAVTLSGGVAELEPHITTADGLLAAAAARLARAKGSGRNRVVFCDGDDGPG